MDNQNNNQTNPLSAAGLGGAKPATNGNSGSQYPNFYSSSQPSNPQTPFVPGSGSTFNPTPVSNPASTMSSSSTSQYQTTFKAPVPPSYASKPPKSPGGKGILIFIIILLIILIGGGVFYKFIYPKLGSLGAVKNPTTTSTTTNATDDQGADYQVKPIDTTKPVATTTPIVKAPTSTAPVVFYVDTVNAQHQYKDGVHTFTGTISVPSSCYLLDTKVGVAKNDPKAARIAFTTKNATATCDSTWTDRTFRISLKGSSDVKFDATINNKATTLNVTEFAVTENVDQPVEVMKG